MSRSFTRAFLGAIGGMVGWLFVEPFATDVSSLEELFRPAATVHPVLLLVFPLSGACIGVALAGLEEAFWGDWRKGKRLLFVVGGLGFVGSLFAFSLGERIFMAFKPLVLGSRASTFWLVVARSIAWAMMGGLIGMALGAARKSWKGALHAGAGGLLGGFWGGLLFDTAAPFLGMMLTAGLVESGWSSRLIGFVLLGAFIGFFSTAAEQFLAPALLKVISSGRMEGREFPLDKPIVTVGRDERCDVTLYYDRTVSPRHARFIHDGGHYIVVPEGKAKVFVNGRPVNRHRLQPGDVITVGQTKLMFRLKTTPFQIAGNKCPHCHRFNRPTAKFCTHCGRRL